MNDSNTIPLRFSGSTHEYFRIWFVNLVLSVLTLGIYSAWAKVRTQQYLYRHTWFQDNNFDYHADALPILRGRILFALLLIAAAVTQYYALWSLGVVFAIGFVMTPWVLVSVLRFKAKNSSYKNIRFSFHGRTRESYKTMIVGGLVYAFTCGLGVFFWQYKLYDFVSREHRFGDLQFSFKPKATDFFSVYALALLFYIGLAVFFIVTAVVVKMALGGGETPKPVTLFFLYGSFFVVEAFLNATLTNLIWGGLKIGEHQVRSTQTFWGVLFLQATNIIGIALSLGLLIPWTKIRNVRYRIEHLALVPQGDIIAKAGPLQKVSALWVKPSTTSATSNWILYESAQLPSPLLRRQDHPRKARDLEGL